MGRTQTNDSSRIYAYEVNKWKCQNGKNINFIFLNDCSGTRQQPVCIYFFFIYSLQIRNAINSVTTVILCYFFHILCYDGGAAVFSGRERLYIHYDFHCEIKESDKHVDIWYYEHSNRLSDILVKKPIELAIELLIYCFSQLMAVILHRSSALVSFFWIYSWFAFR